MKYVTDEGITKVMFVHSKDKSTNLTAIMIFLGPMFVDIVLHRMHLIKFPSMGSIVHLKELELCTTALNLNAETFHKLTLKVPFVLTKEDPFNLIAQEESVHFVHQKVQVAMTLLGIFFGLNFIPKEVGPKLHVRG